MALAELFNHTCDIYHIKRMEHSPGYGLPSAPVFSYDTQPDVLAVPCHFGIKNSTITIAQKEPQATYEARIKLVLPQGTDICINDKIIHCETEYEYTADVPQDVRGHHIFVYVQRKSSQEAL